MDRFPFVTRLADFPPPKLPVTKAPPRVYRVARRGFDPLCLTGSLKAGGRYNPKGDFGALYTSVEAATAVAEVAKGLRAAGIEPSKLPVGEWLIYEIEMGENQILDLTNPDVLARLGVHKDSLIGDDLSLTQRIAGEAKKRGYNGILAPSAAHPSGVNLIVFSSTDTLSMKILSPGPVTFEQQ